METMDIQEILEYLPHRYPFLLIDRVLTVEPGIYFIPTLIDIWRNEGKFTEFINYDKLEEFKTFGGIRIEDDVLVTENGSRVLGTPVPKTVDEIEAIMG